MSGLIFVALAVVWAVVLIPMALRKDDEAARSRAVDRFSTRLRVVRARRSQPPDRAHSRPYDQLHGRPHDQPRDRPRDPARPASSVTGERVTATTTAGSVPRQRRPQGSAHRIGSPESSDADVDATGEIPVVREGLHAHAPVPARGEIGSESDMPAQAMPTGRRLPTVEVQRRKAAVAARRRRRILALLIVLVVVVGALSVLDVLVPWAAAVPASVMALYLLVARVTVRRQRAKHAAERVQAALLARAEAERVAAAALATAVETARVEALEHAESLPEVEFGLPVPSNLDIGIETPEQLGSQTSSLWEPLPITLPTYVDKERARRSVRTISLSDVDVANAGRDAADSALVAHGAGSDDARHDQDSESSAPRAVGS